MDALYYDDHDATIEAHQHYSPPSDAHDTSEAEAKATGRPRGSEGDGRHMEKRWCTNTRRRTSRGAARAAAPGWFLWMKMGQVRARAKPESSLSSHVPLQDFTKFPQQ
jgi:hypothetical protein